MRRKKEIFIGTQVLTEHEVLVGDGCTSRVGRLERGGVVILKEGDLVPCDCAVSKMYSFEVVV